MGERPRNDHKCRLFMLHCEAAPHCLTLETVRVKDNALSRLSWGASGLYVLQFNGVLGQWLSVSLEC